MKAIPKNLKTVVVLASMLSCLAIDTSAQQKAGDLKLTTRISESGRGDKVDADFGELTVPEKQAKA